MPPAERLSRGEGRAWRLAGAVRPAAVRGWDSAAGARRSRVPGRWAARNREDWAGAAAGPALGLAVSMPVWRFGP